MFGYCGGFNMMLGGLLFFILLIVLIGGIVWLVTMLARREPGASAVRVPTNTNASVSNSNLLAILQTRYAKGEITKEQFEEMKRELGVG